MLGVSKPIKFNHVCTVSIKQIYSPDTLSYDGTWTISASTQMSAFLLLVDQVVDTLSSTHFYTDPVEPEPWVQLDVNVVVAVKGVRLFTDLAHDFTETQVFVGMDADYNNNVICYDKDPAVPVQEEVTLDCWRILPGRIVTIQKTGQIYLKEIEIRILDHQGEAQFFKTETC